MLFSLPEASLIHKEKQRGTLWDLIEVISHPFGCFDNLEKHRKRRNQSSEF